jgi:hypothetical protein
MSTKLQLSVDEAIEYKGLTEYWDGYVAGAKVTADHAKSLALKKIMQSRKPTPPPAQPEPPKE